MCLLMVKLRTAWTGKILFSFQLLDSSSGDSGLCICLVFRTNLLWRIQSTLMPNSHRTGSAAWPKKVFWKRNTWDSANSWERGNCFAGFCLRKLLRKQANMSHHPHLLSLKVSLHSKECLPDLFTNAQGAVDSSAICRRASVMIPSAVWSTFHS